MTTEEYRDWLIARTGKQTTPAEMLQLMNIAQNEIFSKNTYFNMIKPANSLTLATTAGILQYTIADTSIRQISKLFYNNYTNSPPSGYPSDVSYMQYEDIPAQVQESISTDSNVVVYFDLDPGDTTNYYYYNAYTWPTNGQLTSTAVQLSLPESVQTGLMAYIVTRMLEEDKDGRSIYNVEREKALYKLYYSFANQGARIFPNTTVPREA